jgi:hypothetical protein
MNEKQEIRAKALEIAALIMLGPTQKSHIDVMAKKTFDEYLPLATFIGSYLASISANQNKSAL